MPRKSKKVKQWTSSLIPFSNEWPTWTSPCLSKFSHLFLSCHLPARETKHRATAWVAAEGGKNQQAKPDFRSTTGTMQSTTQSCKWTAESRKLTVCRALPGGSAPMHILLMPSKSAVLTVPSVWTLERPYPFWLKKLFQRNKGGALKTFHIRFLKPLPLSI